MTPTQTAAPAALPSAPTSPDGIGQNAAALKSGQTIQSLTASKPHIAEPKLDGWRLHVHRAEDGVHLYTRSGKEHTGQLPAIEAELEALPVGTWLDTEAVAFTVENGNIVHKWGLVQSILGSAVGKKAVVKAISDFAAKPQASDAITLVAFDLISHAGIDARSLPYAKRRKLLESIFDQHDWKHTILVPQIEPTEASLNALLAQGYEGMMLKALDAPYASGKRGKGWTKIKPQDTLDGIIMGYKDGENGFTGLVGAVCVGQYDQGDLIEVTRCSGMDMATRKKISANRDAYLGKVIEVKHMGQMETGGYRHPQWHRLRPDKAATDCTV